HSHVCRRVYYVCHLCRSDVRRPQSRCCSLCIPPPPTAHRHGGARAAAALRRHPEGAGRSGPRPATARGGHPPRAPATRPALRPVVVRPPAPAHRLRQHPVAPAARPGLLGSPSLGLGALLGDLTLGAHPGTEELLPLRV